MNLSSCQTLKERERIILFTRYPETGKVKTRLIPALGPEGSCALHRQLTELAVKQLQTLTARRPVSIEVCFEGGDEIMMQAWLGADLLYSPQGQGDLGFRMAQAFQRAFHAGYKAVVLIGSDCPTRGASILQQAFEGLKNHDLVLGPALDGGYYLIGLQKPDALFDDIPWGGEEVFKRTLDKAKALGLNVFLLESLRDIDRPEDLEFWESLEPLNYLSQPDLSIIIPTLNEALDLPLTLARIPQDPSIEVLVVDGGSLDGTLESAASWGAKVISSSRGRARQMNTGAGEAKGQTLLFLHADTLLPEGFKNHIDQVLFRKENVAGAFPLTFEPLLPGLKYIEKLANWRARALQLPYGDQALFLRANLFRALGGFKDIPIMEDVELIGRLKREGRIGIAQAAVITSSRRWKDQGVWRTTLRNQVALGAFRAGISLDRLARWYHKGSQKAPGKMAEER